MIFALTLIMGCVKNKIPEQFQDPRNPKPVMYERTQIQVAFQVKLSYTINNNDATRRK